MQVYIAQELACSLAKISTYMQVSSTDNQASKYVHVRKNILYTYRFSRNVNTISLNIKFINMKDTHAQINI